jgi:hypothetical protein
MAITASMVRAGMQRWAREQARTLEAIQRALEIVYRDHPRPRTLDDLATSLLLAVAHRHEGRVESSLSQLDGALTRLLDDMDSLRTAAEEGRAPALREADLHIVADALAEMTRFEDRVRFILDHNATELQSTMRDILRGPTPHPDVPATPAPTPAGRRGPDVAVATPPPVRVSRELANHIIRQADEVVEAWRQGRTVEPQGVAPVVVPWPDHPVLAAQMRRMQDAVDAYRSAAPGFTDPAAAARAVDDLQRAVADGTETLRSFGRRFESVSSGDRLPPSHPLPAGTTPPPGSAAADALAAQARLATLSPTATIAELSDALRFSDLRVSATGTLSEPLARTVPGIGLERYLLRPSEIRALPTSPPWLSGRLADLLAGWERAHLIGPGFGGELFAGLMLAPWGVNQLAQNRGAERTLRQLAEGSRSTGGPAITPTVTATGRRLAIPLANGGFEYVDLLVSVRYELPRRGRPPVRIDIQVGPDGSWRVTHNLSSGTWPADVPLSGAR